MAEHLAAYVLLAACVAAYAAPRLRGWLRFVAARALARRLSALYGCRTSLDRASVAVGRDAGVATVSIAVEGLTVLDPLDADAAVARLAAGRCVAALSTLRGPVVDARGRVAPSAPRRRRGARGPARVLSEDGSRRRGRADRRRASRGPPRGPPRGPSRRRRASKDPTAPPAQVRLVAYRGAVLRLAERRPGRLTVELLARPAPSGPAPRGAPEPAPAPPGPARRPTAGGRSSTGCSGTLVAHEVS